MLYDLLYFFHGEDDHIATDRDERNTLVNPANGEQEQTTLSSSASWEPEMYWTSNHPSWKGDRYDTDVWKLFQRLAKRSKKMLCMVSCEKKGNFVRLILQCKLNIPGIKFCKAKDLRIAPVGDIASVQRSHLILLSIMNNTHKFGWNLNGFDLDLDLKEEWMLLDAGSYDGDTSKILDSRHYLVETNFHPENVTQNTNDIELFLFNEIQYEVASIHEMKSDIKHYDIDGEFNHEEYQSIILLPS